MPHQSGTIHGLIRNNWQNIISETLPKCSHGKVLQAKLCPTQAILGEGEKLHFLVELITLNLTTYIYRTGIHFLTCNPLCIISICLKPICFHEVHKYSNMGHENVTDVIQQVITVQIHQILNYCSKIMTLNHHCQET